MDAKRYVVVDENRLRSNAMAYCRAHGLVMTKQLVLNGLNDSLFSNMRSNYMRNKTELDAEYNTDDYMSVGRMQIDYYNSMLEVFHLKDEYRVPVRDKSNTTKANVSSTTTNNSDIAEQLKNIEFSINRLGNVMMQILEKMPKQTVSNTIHTPADKPIAVVKK